MTEEEATKLLRENDWCKFSDARELLLEAAAIGAQETMESIELELRRLHAENEALKAKNQPLSIQAISDIADEMTVWSDLSNGKYVIDDYFEFARAIEASHGIKNDQA